MALRSRSHLVCLPRALPAARMPHAQRSRAGCAQPQPVPSPPLLAEFRQATCQWWFHRHAHRPMPVQEEVPPLLTLRGRLPWWAMAACPPTPPRPRPYSGCVPSLRAFVGRACLPRPLRHPWWAFLPWARVAMAVAFGKLPPAAAEDRGDCLFHPKLALAPARIDPPLAAAAPEFRGAHLGVALPSSGRQIADDLAPRLQSHQQPAAAAVHLPPCHLVASHPARRRAYPRGQVRRDHASRHLAASPRAARGSSRRLASSDLQAKERQAAVPRTCRAGRCPGVAAMTAAEVGALRHSQDQRGWQTHATSQTHPRAACQVHHDLAAAAAVAQGQVHQHRMAAVAAEVADASQADRRRAAAVVVAHRRHPSAQTHPLQAREGGLPLRQEVAHQPVPSHQDPVHQGHSRLAHPTSRLRQRDCSFPPRRSRRTLHHHRCPLASPRLAVVHRLGLVMIPCVALDPVQGSGDLLREPAAASPAIHERFRRDRRSRVVHGPHRHATPAASS
mmetsp:Transcript_6312/g.16355  ORF Transcript_6312/g.16355 Transcript_6312/m.16355 type:complete len:503 (-) Transcript_6312:691-2199(-)